MKTIPQRRDKLRRILRKSSANAVLVTNRFNVTYLTGFTGDSSYLLLTADEAVILSDSRYTVQIGEQCPGLDAEIRTSSLTMPELVQRVVRRIKIGNLAVEGDDLTKNGYDALAAALSPVELVATSGWVEKLREIKDREELQEIRRSIDMAQRAFDVIRAGLRPEQTEREVAHLLEHQIRLFGGVECAFEPIVGVGPRAALPHGIPSERTIGSAPFVLIDWGAKAGLYTSDLTRVLVTAKIPPKLERIYRVVLNAQLAAIRKIRPGVRASEVDHAARSVIAKAGHGRHFGHGLGHGFGLEIHESPRLHQSNDAPLKSGMVITVEPGIYLEGWGGVRIEDDVLVTRDGHEVLTSVTKDLEQCVVY